MPGKIQAKSIPKGIKFAHNPAFLLPLQSGTFHGLPAYLNQEDFCHKLIYYYHQLSRLTVGSLLLNCPNAGTAE
ncbi:hypothetical protein OC25_02425 [Pedobacter kyungheensis]|uniref:Uncharacterized protein n=1 Tax=Pedobacter kyungheensis TaxID=1069985 RepID=A0A0C1DGA6_9SPHI|nr:hypothetical protein [Pedobacter kyungheensis]KIA96606.1 hypothetical protein OC25_02425 [Pedobacter kyungheensis]